MDRRWWHANHRLDGKSPDFLWLKKARGDTGQHALYDVVRGFSKSMQVIALIPKVAAMAVISIQRLDFYYMGTGNFIC